MEKLATFSFPSGNSIDLIYRESERRFTCQWSRFPPSPKDVEHYCRVIVPKLNDVVKRRLGIDNILHAYL